MITHSKPWLTQEDFTAVAEVLQSGMISRGQRVEEFEKAVADYYGSSGSIAVGSGTAALILALKSIDVSRGDEVILPTYVCISVAQAVLAVGAIPILCDVGEYWCMTPETVKPYISLKTKAIILVHIFGIAINVEDFKEFGIPIIEDCCQAFGAGNNNQKIGMQGMVSVFSFQATKCLTTGEGGLVLSPSALLINKAKEINKTKEVASPMTDIQAALGLSQFKRYPEMLERRHEIAELYFQHFPERWTRPLSTQRMNSIFFRFPLVVDEDFVKFQNDCQNSGIAVRKGVDSLIHRHLNMSDEKFSNSVELFRKTISVPIYPALTDEQIKLIVATFTSMS